MKFKEIEFKIHFDSTPHDLYEVIMDEEKHSKITESEVSMVREVDGEFSMWDGGIHGKNLILVPNEKIVQEWRSDEETWPTDHFSKVTFLFIESKGGTEMMFTQTEVPQDSHKKVKDGWKKYYWEPMKKYFKEMKN